MSTYRVTVRAADGMLHTARPLTAPDPISDLIDGLLYNVAELGRTIDVGVEVTVETDVDSEHPIGDSIVGTSSGPLPSLPGGRRVEDDDDELDVDAPLLTPAVQS